MNVVQEIRRINELELASGSSGSWHDQYKDSAYINVGGLPYNLTEGDVIAIFSQYGEVVDITMPRDQNTQKPKGFAFVMYADQRSTVLAVDNLGGAKVLDRTLRVDHVLNYKQLERDDETGKMKESDVQRLSAHPSKFLPSTQGGEDDTDADSDSSHPSIDPDDPMRDYLIEQRRAAKKSSKGKKRGREGETKEERRARREKKKKSKEEKERRKVGSDRKAIDDGRSKERERERDRDGNGDRSRDDGRRGGEISRGDRRDHRDRDEAYSRYRNDDRDRDDRHRDGRERSERRPEGSGGGGGRSSAFADLEKWATGRG